MDPRGTPRTRPEPPTSVPDGPQASQPHLLKYALRVLLLYRWTWIGATVLCVLGVAVAMFTVTPRYTADCLVMIEPGKLNITEFKEVYDPTMTGGGVGDARREFTETQYHLMLSEPVLEKVFLRFGFGDHALFRGASDPLPAFRACFSVDPIRRTRLARVQFEWVDPEMAARALAYLVRTYIEEYRRRRLGVTAEGLAALKAKAGDLRPKVESRAEALQHFMVEHNMVSLEENQDIVKERLKEISTALTEVEAQRIRSESRYQNIREAVAGKRPLEDLPEVNENPIIRDLKLELVKAVQEIKHFSERFGENHPEMRRMVVRRDVLRGRLEEETRGILSAAEADLDRYRRQQAELERALVAQESKVMEQNRLAVQYNLLKDGYESTNASYKSIIKRIEEIEIASAAGSKEDNVFEITAPKVPSAPSFPRKKQSIALAALVGLLLGFALSFLLHSLDGSLKSVEDVEGELGLAVLGLVPAAGRHARGDRASDLYSLANPRGPFAEAFRSLRTSLSLARAGETLRRVLVTSPSPGEGKDLVSVNMAISIARSGRRVLLIDADMRRPRQHKVFGVRANPGLANLLAGQRDGDPLDLVRPTVVPGLGVLPAGPVPPNPVELLAAPRMRELLDHFAADYDVLVINSPPVMAVSDPVVLSRLVQGTVLVLRAFGTRREEARRALEILHRARAELLGAVLNLVDVPKSQADHYAYGGYAYGVPDVEESGPPTRSARGTDASGPRVRLESKVESGEKREPVFES